LASTNKEDISVLEVVWYETSMTSQNDPTCRRASKILDENGRLPRWNVAFNTLPIKINNNKLHLGLFLYK
jgi:hypothetical protein